MKAAGASPAARCFGKTKIWPSFENKDDWQVPVDTLQDTQVGALADILLDHFPFPVLAAREGRHDAQRHVIPALSAELAEHRFLDQNRTLVLRPDESEDDAVAGDGQCPGRQPRLAIVQLALQESPTLDLDRQAGEGEI